jgi:hypothetical protein
MNDGPRKTLEACCMGRGCQGEEVALGIQRDRRNVDGGEPMARRQKHVAYSLDLPFNDVGGLGWENRTGLRPRGGGRHRQGVVVAKPGGLVDKGVTRGKRMTMGDVARSLGEDTREQEEVRRQGDILWMDGVDRHRFDIGVPEASPWSSRCVGGRRGLGHIVSQTLPQVILIALEVQRLRVDGGKSLIEQAAIRSRQTCLGTQKRRRQRGGEVPPHCRRCRISLSED